MLLLLLGGYAAPATSTPFILARAFGGDDQGVMAQRRGADDQGYMRLRGGDDAGIISRRRGMDSDAG